MKRRAKDYIIIKYKQARKKKEDFLLFYGVFTVLLLILGALLFSFLLFQALIPSKTLKVTFYDVGQGDAIYIESGAKTKVLIDGGPSKVIVEKVGREISFLDKSIDFIAPSHGDKDHITGSIAVLERFPTKYVSAVHASTATELDDEYGAKTRNIVSIRSVAGDTIDIGGGALLTVILPKKAEVFSEKETNESSSVLLLTYGEFSFLFTGDLPETRERELIDSGKLPRDLTVLKLGHHGSKYSTGKELLSYTKPKFVIVSSGKGNNYGHPSKEVLERVEKVKSKVLRTDDMGDIRFIVKKNSLTFDTEK